MTLTRCPPSLPFPQNSPPQPPSFGQPSASNAPGKQRRRLVRRRVTGEYPRRPGLAVRARGRRLRPPRCARRRADGRPHAGRRALNGGSPPTRAPGRRPAPAGPARPAVRAGHVLVPSSCARPTANRIRRRRRRGRRLLGREPRLGRALVAPLRALLRAARRQLCRPAGQLRRAPVRALGRADRQLAVPRRDEARPRRRGRRRRLLAQALRDPRRRDLRHAQGGAARPAELASEGRRRGASRLGSRSFSSRPPPSLSLPSSSDQKKTATEPHGWPLALPLARAAMRTLAAGTPTADGPGALAGSGSSTAGCPPGAEVCAGVRADDAGRGTGHSPPKQGRAPVCG